MAHQYKVGDKVRIIERRGLREDYPFPFGDYMSSLTGVVCKINKISPVSIEFPKSKFYNGDDNIYELCPILPDSRDFMWNWHSSMFEPVEELGNPIITPLLTQANLGDSVKILHLDGFISKNSKEHYFIRFSEEDHIHKEMAWCFYTPELKRLAIDFNAVPGYRLSPHFKSIMSLLAFVNEVNLRYKPKESIKQSTITPKTLNENEIRFQKPEATATGGFVPTGHSIRGREHKITVVIGHLSNQKISC